VNENIEMSRLFAGDLTGEGALPWPHLQGLALTDTESTNPDSCRHSRRL
jgi:hypothetical protein